RDGKVVSFKELMEEYILVQIKQLSEQVAKKNLNNTSSNVVLEKENSQKPRYLTKSRFTVAMECPTKLFYTGKKEYVNNSLEDPFLEALAEGGFQVGELATAYYPGGK